MPVLTGAYVQPQEFSAPICVYADPDDDRLRHHLVVDVGFAIRCVEEHERILGLLQRPVPKSGDLFMEVRADPGALRLGDSGIRAQGLDQVIDSLGRDPM